MRKKFHKLSIFYYNTNIPSLGFQISQIEEFLINILVVMTHFAESSLQI